MKFRYIHIAFLYFFLLAFTANARSGYPPITPLQKVYMEAYSKIPKDVLHPLRPLGLLAGCQGDWMSYNHDGIEVNGMPDPELEDAVCALMDILPTAYQDSFMVFDYGMYPPLTFIDRGEAHDLAFECMVDRVENEYNPPYYLLMGKQINPEDGSVEFRVKLNLPTYNEFSDVNEMLEQSFTLLVEEAIQEEYEALNALILLPNCEVKGIEKLTEIIQGLIAGNHAGGLVDDILFSNGFFPLAVDAEGITRTGQKTVGNNVHGFAGLQESGFSISVELRSIMPAVGYTYLTVVTDDDNYSSGGTSDFEEARVLFEEADEKMVFWFHLHTPSDTSAAPIMFLKLRNNFTESEAESILQSRYANYWSTNNPALTSGGGDDRSVMGACPDVYLSFSWNTKGSGGENLYNCIEDETGLNEYFGGMACGVIDGIVGNLNFVSSAGKTLIDFTRYGMPTSCDEGGAAAQFSLLGEIANILYESVTLETAWGVWWGDIDFDLSAGAEKHMTGKAKFLAFVREVMCNILQPGRMATILNALGNAFSTMFGNVSGQNGDKAQGYSHGNIIFEIVTLIFSGGASGVAALTKVGKESLEALWKSVKNGSFNGYWGGKWTAIKDTAAGAKCRILATGCFVRGTPVLLAGAIGVTPTPIENVQLFDYALANTLVNANQNLVASADENYIGLLDDPFTSNEQRQRDRYELNDTDWYEVAFQKVMGKSRVKLALHKDWMAQKGIKEVGSVADMNLPEQGISGSFMITSIRHILPQKKPVDENPDDDYEYRPVTGIFVHESDNVQMLYFENGDSLGVTPNHPIYSASAGGWRLAGELRVGKKVLTKSGTAVVTSKVMLENVRTVHNLEVRELHNFLVGNDGVVAHNNCWDDAGKYASGQLNKADIWTLNTHPQIFQRGNIIEKVARKSKYKGSDGWTYTGKGDGGLGISNYWLIDFHKGDKVVSLKSTQVTSPTQWANSNATHIQDLSTRKITGSFPNCTGCTNPSHTITGVSKVELHIVVKDLSQINKNDWVSAIKAKLPVGEKENLIITMTEL